MSCDYQICTDTDFQDFLRTLEPENDARLEVTSDLLPGLNESLDPISNATAVPKFCLKQEVVEVVLTVQEETNVAERNSRFSKKEKCIPKRYRLEDDTDRSDDNEDNEDEEKEEEEDVSEEEDEEFNTKPPQKVTKKNMGAFSGGPRKNTLEKNICSHCLKPHRTPSLLKRHLLSHTGKKAYECDTCGKRCATTSNINRHILTHTGEKPHACDACDNRFFQKQHLKDHMRKQHNVENPLKCNKCSRLFALKTNYTAHLPACNETTYECPTCGKKFERKNSFSGHLRMCGKNTKKNRRKT